MNRVTAARELLKVVSYLVRGEEITEELKQRLDDAEKQGKKYICYTNVDGNQRIMACRDVRPGVTKGTVGGFIESEDNLSHDGSSWIGSMAQVYGDATVKDDAYVFGKARVYGNATISDRAKVRGEARVFGNAVLKDDAEAYGRAKVGGSTRVSGHGGVARSVSNGEITSRDRDPDAPYIERPRLKTRPAESYVWDPGHDNRPRGGDWHKTERGWSTTPVKKKVWEF